MMKDLIIITAFCDNDKKIELLHNLVTDISKTKKYDILICSHTILPEYIVKKVDYYFYDKENYLLEDYDLINPENFIINGTTFISTIFNTYKNTIYAVWKLYFSGLNIAKTLGYEKAHIVEYDTIILDIEEFEERSKLIENNDILLYRNEIGNMVGPTQTINLNSLPQKILTIDREFIVNLVRESGHKLPEILFEELWLSENKNILSLSEKDLKNNYGNISTLRLKDTIFPYFSNEYVKLFIRCNSLNINTDITVIINDNLIKKCYVDEKHWCMFYFIEHIDNLNKFKIIRDNTVLFSFENKDEILNFKNFSFES